MIAIDNKLISDDLAEVKFVCDLSRCKGACCVEGDSGAPLEFDELDQIEDNYDIISEYITEEGKSAIEAHGHFDLDKEDGTMKTTLINNKACAYVNYKDGISYCGIEKAWLEKRIDFRKPVSCHLYPVRITKHADFEAVNYEEWDICAPACDNGNKLQIPVYQFVKQALIRKYGVSFYEQLAGAIAFKNKKD